MPVSMTPRRKRIAVIVAGIVGLAIAAALILTAFQKNLMYFYSPSDVAAGKAPDSRSFRIGGMVVEHSVLRDPETLEVRFTLTDFAHERVVRYEGILPDLFREGQGIVANGKLDKDGVFVAAEVLAKHDENYMPPEVASALDAAAAAKQIAQ